jgi:hypothetical protein
MKKIMFSDAFCLTQAVLNGTKTMTRRLLKVPKTCNGKEVYSFNVLTNNAGTQCVDLVGENGGVLGSWKPHYEVGEVVAIAQPYKDIYPNADFEMIGDKFMTESAGWTNKMFVKADLMPRHIQFTDAKVEHLQDISDKECLREGVWQFYDNKDLFYVSKNIGYAPDVAFPTAREAFLYLIDKVSGKGTWESNPLVAAYSFELID